jgi:hypothetical protein
MVAGLMDPMPTIWSILGRPDDDLAAAGDDYRDRQDYE